MEAEDRSIQEVMLITGRTIYVTFYLCNYSSELSESKLQQNVRAQIGGRLDALGMNGGTKYWVDKVTIEILASLLKSGPTRT